MQQTDNLQLNLPEYTDTVDIEQLNDNFRQLDTSVSGKLGKTGDGSDVTGTFTEATTRANIATGEKLSVMFGKIAKWFADLGTLAFKSSVAKSDLSSGVQESLDKADSALQSAPVTSVNGQTGAVTIETSSLPVVNATDDGKFLRVVDGVWSKASVPRANGEGF